MLVTLFEPHTDLVEECVKSRSLELVDATLRVNYGVIARVTCARWLKTTNEPSTETHKTMQSRTSGPQCCQPLSSHWFEILRILFLRVLMCCSSAFFLFASLGFLFRRFLDHAFVLLHHFSELRSAWI